MTSSWPAKLAQRIWAHKPLNSSAMNADIPAIIQNKVKLCVYFMKYHYTDVSWTSCRLHLVATRLFVVQHVQANNKTRPRSALLTLFEGNPPVDSPHEGPKMRQSLSCEDIFMYCTSIRQNNSSQVCVNMVAADSSWYKRLFRYHLLCIRRQTGWVHPQ